MSLPLTARWEYRNEPDVGTREGRTLAILKQKPPPEWVEPKERVPRHLKEVPFAELLAELSKRKE